MSMMKKRLNPVWCIVVVGVLLVALTLVMTISAPVLAAHPIACYGNVTLDEDPAPIGTVVNIYLGADLVASGVTEEITPRHRYDYVLGTDFIDEDRYSEEFRYTVGDDGFPAIPLGPDPGVFGDSNQWVDLEAYSITEPPTLDDIDWTDVDDSGTINEGDTLTFEFSEGMNTDTITIANVNTTLPTVPSHSYGTLTAGGLVWSNSDKWLTLALGSGEAIVGGETVNPSASVTDKAGNPDATTSPGPSIPTPDITGPALTSIDWTDVDDSGTINVGDKLTFKFSEGMNTDTITVANVNTTLPTVPSHSYGTLTAGGLIWSNSDKWLTLTLGSGEAIVGGETVNPSALVTDKAGNADATTSPVPSIPTPDITGPTLTSIVWTDVDDSGTINVGDKLIFKFSEAMKTTTLDTVSEINSRLDSSATGTVDYGATFSSIWNSVKTQLTVTLGSGEDIVGGETVNPADDVTDKAGNSDATTSPGSAIPIPVPGPTTTIDDADEFVNEVPAITGDASAVSGRTVETVEVQIQRESDNKYWTGSAWQTDSVWIDAEADDGTFNENQEDWHIDNADLPEDDDMDNGTEYTVGAKSQDDEDDWGDEVTATFIYDSTDPNTTIDELNDAITTLTSITGGATDTAPGVVGGVEVQIQRESDDKYWTGSTWQTASIWIDATAADGAFDGDEEDWKITTATSPKLPVWEAGTNYYVMARAIDKAGNVDQSPATESFTYEGEGQGWLWWYTLLIVLGVLIVIAAIALVVVRSQGGGLEEFTEDDLYGDDEDF
jgi:uncharacterized Zn-binding protein involved in type VI secretion